MASRKSPLRDRLLSNSPDPIKSSILRESGMGWNTASSGSSSNTGSITSPLRISKRDSPTRPRGPVVARRTSSSYRHVHTNNLVSKSPFKSQIPTPSTPSSRPPPVSFPTRRVSGEKRPRPPSMHEQAEVENDRPFALKRERKQSKTFQELIQREPVTKSPFRSLQPTPVSEARSPPPPVPSPHDVVRPSSSSPAPFHMHVPSAPNSKLSPARPALVSRRMHGPRLSGSSRRERRKTVTFHERCDVLEFDREEETEDEEVFESGGEEERMELEEDLQESETLGDPFIEQELSHEAEDQPMEEESYESIQLSDTGLNLAVPSLLSDPDASITGLVDEMFAASGSTNLLADDSLPPHTSTPPRHTDIPTDLETEDGVPFGRSHHVERFLQHHQHSSPHIQQPPHFSPRASPLHRLSPSGSYPHNLGLPTHASPHGPPATPPRRSPGMQFSTPPLGRSTHLERILQARDEEEDETLEDVEQLPGSPSPMKKKLSSEYGQREDGLIPKFDLKPGTSRDSLSNLSGNVSIDPFAPRIQDESVLSDLEKQSNLDASQDSMDPANLSIGNSGLNISGLASELDRQEVLQSLAVSPQPLATPQHDDRRQSTPPLSLLSRRVDSPASRSGSPSLNVRSDIHPLTKSVSRERITKEEVQRRLMGHRHQGSPGPLHGPRSSTVSPQQNSAPSDETSESSPPSLSDISDKDKDRLSVWTTQTDFSVETAIVEVAHKRTISMSSLAPESDTGKEFGLLEATPQLQMDFGSRFSLGGFGPSSADVEIKSVDSRDSLGVLTAKPAAPRTGTYESTGSGIKMGDVDVDMDMKSALDRLMEDVAGGAGAPRRGGADDSMTTDEDESFDRSQSMTREESPFHGASRPKVLERAATDSVLLQHNEADGVMSRSVSGSSTITLPPPPVPPKDNIRSREQLILEKRREARRTSDDYDEDMDGASSRGRDLQNLGHGRPSRRRSMSTGDAEVLQNGARKRGEALLDVVSESGHEDLLADSIEKELQKLAEAPKNMKSKYHIRERAGTIYASSSEEKISHMAGAGDLDAGRAWRTVRRPSDMNEYAKQIKEYRAQDKGKAYGKVFVKVMGIKGIRTPLPQQTTAITCTLNNGIHFVTTPEVELSQECPINQEFELIEHSKLEFTLTLKVRRDPHIIAQYKALAPAAPAPAPPPPPVVVQTASKSYGMRSFFSSSPKKSSKEKIVAQPPPRPIPQQQPVRLTENLARYLKPDGTLARAFISFKDIASHCDTKPFQTIYPLIGQRVEAGGKFSTLEVGEIVLQMFRLPPLPGIPQDQLPQSLEECHRGLRHINWHKVTYFQGTLTQNGGDCSTWRRRQLRVIGSNLVAFNDVTKRATATIDLKKATAVEDTDERSSTNSDEYDGLYGVERSFRLLFPQNQEILFFADTDEEKARWLEVLRALVGHIPPHPLWAELLWQRREEIVRRQEAEQHTLHQPQPSGLQQR